MHVQVKNLKYALQYLPSSISCFTLADTDPILCLLKKKIKKETTNLISFISLVLFFLCSQQFTFRKESYTSKKVFSHEK